MKHRLFQWYGLAAAAGLAAGVLSCAPKSPAYKATQEQGTYMASSNRLFEDDGDFDLRKRVVFYEEAKRLDPTITNDTNRKMTEAKCSLCHECGFKQAWDLANYGKPEWRPRYKGETWGPVVQRMRVMDGSMLNEQIADRVYSFLRDASLGKYDEAADPKNKVVYEVEEFPEVIESPETAAKRKKQESEEQRKRAEEGSAGG